MNNSQRLNARSIASDRRGNPAWTAENSPEDVRKVLAELRQQQIPQGCPTIAQRFIAGINALKTISSPVRGERILADARFFRPSKTAGNSPEDVRRILVELRQQQIPQGCPTIAQRFIAGTNAPKAISSPVRGERIFADARFFRPSGTHHFTPQHTPTINRWAILSRPHGLGPAKKGNFTPKTNQRTRLGQREVFRCRVWTFRTGWPDSFCRFRASATRRCTSCPRAADSSSLMRQISWSTKSPPPLTVGSLMVFMVSFSEKFFRRVNFRKGVAMRPGQPANPADDGCIGNVPAIPCQQYIHLVDGGESNMCGVAYARRKSSKAILRNSRSSWTDRQQFPFRSRSFSPTWICVALCHRTWSSRSVWRIPAA
jgi:hypothetical protein